MRADSRKPVEEILGHLSVREELVTQLLHLILPAEPHLNINSSGTTLHPIFGGFSLDKNQNHNQ